jgi:glycosyltransferase involved in cell wall biosynthesis
MASVLAIYERYGIGGDVRPIPSWAPRTAGDRVKMGLASLASVMRLPKSAIVHVHLSERGSFVREGAILALARKRHLRTVATLHGADFLPFSYSHPRLTAQVLNYPQAVVCLSEAIRARVRLLVPGVPAMRIPNPVVVNNDSPAAATTSELVVFAGEISFRKGADVLERAWPRVAKSRRQARCIIVGPATNLNIASHERLTVRGPVSASQLGRLLCEARVIALPSRAEAMPMILAEAQAAQRPFVATPVGAIPELAAHGGVLVPVGDAESLATALIDLLERPERAAELGLEGQAYVRETRSVEVVDAQLRSVYDALGR